MKVKYKGPITSINPLSNIFRWMVLKIHACKGCSKTTRKRFCR